MKIEKADPIIPISGDKLARRWGIESVDIFFVMLNHDLEALGLYGNSVDADIIIDSILESKDKKFSPESWKFDILNVQQLEKEQFADSLTDREKLIRGKALIKKMNFEDTDLFLFVINGELNFVDPFGYPIDLNFIFELLEEGILNVADLLFRIRDIEKFESDYGHLLSERNKVSENKRIPSVSDLENSDIPRVSFFNNGDYWIVGESGKERNLQALKGFEILNILIRREGEEIDAVFLDNLGKISIDNDPAISGYVPDGVKLSSDKLISDFNGDTDGSFNESAYHITDDSSHEELIDEATVASTKSAIEMAKELLESETDPFKILEAKENIEKYEKYLKDALSPSKKHRKHRKFRSQSKENSRTNVKKRIGKALGKIEREVSSLTQYLNNDTIETGTKCIYKQAESRKVRWILDPP